MNNQCLKSPQSCSVTSNSFIDLLDRRTFLKGLGLVLCSLTAHGSKGFKQDVYGPTTETDARFFESIEGKIVQCTQCFRQCMIAPGEAGRCRIRINRNGRLMTMSYGNPGAVNIDPVEKKPFSHVLPGTLTYSVALIGCNIDCKFCQNWQIAHARSGSLRVQSLTPEEVAGSVTKSGCKTISYTYSEPTVWSEYVLDCADAGLKRGIGSLVISNGTWAPNVLKQLLTRVKAIKIDLKSIKPDYYRDVCDGELKPVLDNIIAVRKAGVWLELVNLVVPTLNDSEKELREMARWIKEHVGDDVPLHFSRFTPMYKLQRLSPTPVETLTRARDIALETGLKYVYVGNVPQHPGTHTYCPNCKSVVIRRTGYRSVLENLKDGRCTECNTAIPGVWS